MHVEVELILQYLHMASGTPLRLLGLGSKHFLFHLLSHLASVFFFPLSLLGILLGFNIYFCMYLCKKMPHMCRWSWMPKGVSGRLEQ